MRTIHLKIEKESDLYNPFDPEKNISGDVTAYLMKKVLEESPREEVRIRISCPEPVCEEDVKAAFARWIDSSRTEMKRLSRKNLIKMVWLLLIGIALIALSLCLQSKISALLFTIITTVGTFSIWEGANVWILKGPDLFVRKKVFNRIIRSAGIEFAPADDPAVF